MALLLTLLALAAAAAAAGHVPGNSDSPLNSASNAYNDASLAWDRAIVASGIAYAPVVGGAVVIAPSAGLPEDAGALLASNNNCAITVYEGRLYFGWRTARSHFASDRTRIIVVSTPAEELDAILALSSMGADLKATKGTKEEEEEEERVWNAQERVREVREEEEEEEEERVWNAREREREEAVRRAVVEGRMDDAKERAEVLMAMVREEIENGDDGMGTTTLVANATWRTELTVELGTDMREPNFHVAEGQLVFSFFEAGSVWYQFDPKRLWRSTRDAATGAWSPIEVWGQPEEIVWDFAQQEDFKALTSYKGNHYDREARPNMTVFFNATYDDGRTWTPLGPYPGGYVYNGGATEVAVTLDVDGNVWGVSRNDEGDATGWGAHLFFGAAANKGNWQLFPSSARCFPDIYMSPKLFRHGNELYLIGRTDPNGPYDRGYTDLTFEQQRSINIATYSLRRHGTGLWRINKESKTFEFVATLPGCGDTAFPSIYRVAEHRYAVVNYSNPVELCPNWSWLRGQASINGTYVYMLELSFVPV